MSLTKVSYSMINGAVANILDFGADKTGATDSSAAIQSAIDSGAATIFYPQGTYLINTPLELVSFQTHTGDGAELTSSGVIFTHTTVQQFITLEGLKFGGTGKAFYQNDSSVYTFNLTVRDCIFGRTLEECIYATLIFGNIYNNQFGSNNGSVGAQHRHLYLSGQTNGATAVNNNTFSNNRFNAAIGAHSTYIEYGSDNVFQFNDWEDNNATNTIYINGGGTTTFNGNWLESNTGTHQIYFDDTAATTYNIYRNNPINFTNNNVFMLSSGNTYLFYLDANSFNLNMIGNKVYSNQAGTQYLTDTGSGNNKGIVTYLSNLMYDNSIDLLNVDTFNSVYSGTNGFNVIGRSSGQTLFYVDQSGQIGTGTYTNSPYNLTTANAANCVVLNNGVLARSTSSLKYKTDVQDAIHGLEEVLKLRPVTYRGKSDGDRIYGGFIAEEVDALGLTEFVQYDEEKNPDSLAYGQMVSLLVKAIQELSAKVSALENK